MCICIDGMGDLDGLKPGGKSVINICRFCETVCEAAFEFRCRSNAVRGFGTLSGVCPMVCPFVIVFRVQLRVRLSTRSTVQVRYCIQSFSVYSSAPGSCLGSRLVSSHWE
jgi:hypothetical protein